MRVVCVSVPPLLSTQILLTPLYVDFLPLLIYYVGISEWCEGASYKDSRFDLLCFMFGKFRPREPSVVPSATPELYHVSHEVPCTL